MMDLRAFYRYSRALYELAEQQKMLDQIDDQLEAARKLTETHPEISHLLSNSTIALGEKEDFLTKVLPAGTNLLLINFLKVLVKKKRFLELSLIQKEFHRLYEKKKRVEEVIVISAAELSRENAAKLESVLEKKLGSDIRLVNKTNPNMLGGIVIQFAGHEINASFRSRLETLHQNLTA